MSFDNMKDLIRYKVVPCSHPVRRRGGDGLPGAASLPTCQSRGVGQWLADVSPFLLALLFLLLHGDLRKAWRPAQHCQGDIGTRCQRGVKGQK